MLNLILGTDIFSSFSCSAQETVLLLTYTHFFMKDLLILCPEISYDQQSKYSPKKQKKEVLLNMKRILSQRIGALILTMAISLSLVSPCVSYAVEDDCSLQEHQHTSECYKLPDRRSLCCRAMAHSHNPECYDGEGILVCGYSDKIIHTHDKNCYNDDGELVCDLPEHEAHTHMEDCYEESRVLICQEAVLPVIPHEHTESCYENQEKCICVQECDETHVHTEECFQTESVLLCSEGEAVQTHAHTDACYEMRRTTICGEADLSSHLHRAECWDMNGWSICGMLEAVVHQHDDSCFIEEDGGMSDNPQCGMQEHIHSEVCRPSQGDQPNQEGPSIEQEEPSMGDEQESIEYDPVRYGINVNLVAPDDDDADRWFHLSKISGPDVTMPNWVDIHRVGNGTVDYSDILFFSPGTYVFEISCNHFPAEHYRLEILVDEQSGSLYISDVTYTHMPDGTENKEGVVFVVEIPAVSVDFSPAIEVDFVGESPHPVKVGIEAIEVSPDVGYFSPEQIIDGTGKKQLYPISFSKAGTYGFLIRDLSGSNCKDVREYTLTVTVTEDGTELKASGVYSVDSGLNKKPSDCATFIHVKSGTYHWSSATELKARRLLNQMTLEEKVGQLFLLHYSDTTVRTAEDVKAITDKYHPGGYIVFQPDLANESPESFKAKIDQTQKDSKIPLIISIDEEGGKVNRASNLPQYRSSAFPGPQDLKTNGGLPAVLADAADKAAFLKNLGVNMNHAPVADVASTGYIYARTWGGDGLDNASYVEAAVKGMEEAGMGTTLKHFPGYGSTSSNTHNGFAVNYLSENDFRYNDLIPFYAGMNAGNRAVMVTHNTINYLDKQNPASLSPAVYSLLRNQIGFEGLAITDDLNMGAVTSYVGDGNQSLAALKAGADMALVPYPDKQIPPVLAAAKNGELPLRRIEESCFRVLCWKIEHGLMDDVNDLFTDEIDVSIPVKVIIDGIPMQIGEITKARLESSSSGSANYRVPLEEVSDLLGDFGFDLERYVGSMVFGTQLSSDGKLTFAQNSINKIDGEWMLSLPSGANLNNISVMFASKTMVNGSYDVELIASDCGFYSVKVNDVAGSVSEELEDVSSVHYYAAGASTEVTLPQRTAPLTWILNKTDNPAFSYQITTQNGVITVKLNNIFSPIVITSGAEEIVNYTVQYYGLIDGIDKSSTGALDIIDTSGGILPQNGANITPKIMKLTLNGDGTVKTEQSIKKIYLEETFRYRDAPDLSYIDKLKTFDAHYAPVELWVLKDGRNSESTEREDWDVYNKDDLGLESFYDLSLTNISDGIESPSTVVLKNNAFIRILYIPTDGTSESPVDFWDYDITDGYIYSAMSGSMGFSGQANTSTQSNSNTAYANTKSQGINNPNNYTGNGAKFAFGNANTGTGLQSEMVNGMYFNQFNRINGVAQAFKGCFFGIAKQLDSDGNIVFNSNISVPDLFGPTSLVGKTVVNGHSLQFNRSGDTYTLEAVKGTPATNLSSFKNPQPKYTNIWTNNFWPMDSASTFGADGHDLVFGNENYKTKRAFGLGDWETLPVSDDALDHNSYFGMHFTIDFTIPHDYCGDLEYLFFGDDDIWMFLDGKLILDLGGCHSAVGEYVNLWDYIEQGDTSPHQLQFYYLERGASGSTCWIQYTIPSATIINGGTAYNNSLKIRKTLVGGEENNRDFLFTVNLKNGDGTDLQGEYPCITYDNQGNILSVGTMSDGEELLLAGGCYAIIRDLPDYVTYNITESKYDCDSYVQEGTLDLSVIPIDSSKREYSGKSKEEEVPAVFGSDEEDSSSLVPSREISGTVYGGTIVEINYINVFSSIAELPETGGPGLRNITTIGAAVISVGIGFIWYCKKRRSII